MNYYYDNNFASSIVIDTKLRNYDIRNVVDENSENLRQKIDP